LDKSEGIVAELVDITEDIELDSERIDLIMNQMKNLMDLLGNESSPKLLFNFNEYS